MILPLNIRSLRLLPLAITSLSSMCMLLASHPAQAQTINCAVAQAIAGRAYDRVEAALKELDYRIAVESKYAFWHIEEHSRHCRGVQTLAKALTDHGLGKDKFAEPDRRAPGGRGSSTAQSTGSGTGTSGASGASGTSGSGSAEPMLADRNSTVLSIEITSSQGSGSVSGSGAVAGLTGTTGSSSAAEHRRYRVTLRMDDGSTTVITQDTTPNFSNGDRVKLSNGVIVRN